MKNKILSVAAILLALALIAADEQKQVKSYLGRFDSAPSGYRELAWVLMMTSEFSLNH